MFVAVLLLLLLLGRSGVQAVLTDRSELLLSQLADAVPELAPACRSADDTNGADAEGDVCRAMTSVPAPLRNVLLGSCRFGSCRRVAVSPRLVSPRLSCMQDD